MKKSRLGDFIELVDIRNTDNSFGVNKLRGISINKILTPTKADTADLNLKGYKIVRHNWFTYCTVTSRNGNKISIAYNDGDDCIVSAINPVFKIKDGAELLPRYLMMFFNRREFDRYARFNSWGSARETFSWEDFCDIELEIPDKHIQEKYVAIYEGMLANLHSYEKGTDDLKLVCDGFIEDLRRNIISQRIGDYLELSDVRNKDNACSNVKSVSTTKYFNDVGAKVNKNELRNYKVVKPNEISYVQTTGNEKCLAFAINDSDEDIVVTSVNNVFRCKDGLNPYYLGLWFRRKEFDRFARFISWGSARETVSWEDMCNVKIPIPRIEVQNQIVEIFTNLAKRISFSKSIKETISNICPILIRGSIMEAKGGN